MIFFLEPKKWQTTKNIYVDKDQTLVKGDIQLKMKKRNPTIDFKPQKTKDKNETFDEKQ